MFQDVAFALMEQVRRAMPAQGSELNVRTHISRPMWRAFLGFCKLPPDTQPTAWLGANGGTVRVFGSETIVHDDDHFWSVSFAMRSPA